jgi:hypothetical protein
MVLLSLSKHLYRFVWRFNEAVEMLQQTQYDVLEQVKGNSQHALKQLPHRMLAA